MNNVQSASEQSLTGVLSASLDAASPSAPGARMAQPGQAPARFTVSHVADFYRRYPGEPLTFHTRVDVLDTLPGFTVQVSIPNEATPGEYAASGNQNGHLPQLVFAGDNRYLVWTVERTASAGERFEYQLHTTVAPTQTDLALESTALVISGSGDNRMQAAESVEVAVIAKGRYLKYLPALYCDDELMGRYLMLFESFWGPLERQIDNIAYYFDPKMTPGDLLPWLASWGDLMLDERWPEDRRRRLVSSAARLYRMRGTKRGLVEYLEIYTGQKAIITEHRANNLRLGKDAKFGPSIALGRSNRPHSFTVYLRPPPVVLAEGEDERLRTRREEERRRTIESIIEADKPAHTTYTLIIDTAAEA